MNLCIDLTSKILNIADDDIKKMMLTPPDKDLEFSTLHGFIKILWKADENKILEYMAEHPEID